MTTSGRRPRSSSFCDSTQEISFSVDDALDIAHFTTSNGRIIRQAIECRPTKVRIIPETLQDDLADWVPIDGARLPDEDENEEEEVSEDGVKRKRYASDDPLQEWKPAMPIFLKEMFFQDGVGVTGDLECLTCHVNFSPTCRLFKCEACCVALECTSCLLVRHQCHPLHVIKEWTGKFWKAISLSNIGLVYQLGHNGLSCRSPNPLVREMNIIANTGIHRIRIRYCNCHVFNPPSNIEQLLCQKWFPATVTDPGTCATFDVLDTFRLLSVVGNMTAYDFINTLERLTSGARTECVLDCYKAFGRMAREYALLLRIRRSGAFDFQLQESSVPLKKGRLAVPCWACPIEGQNLPPGWRNVDPKHMYLYTLIVAIDANFRLKNRLRHGERSDPPLASGAGYFVDVEPYQEYLRNYISEKDVKSCMAFAAILQKETKATKGLRASGVVACACARHEIIRPNGLGDLQKGERYVNVDWVFLSAIQGLMLLRYAMSYDIVCQWKKAFWDRMFRLPKQLHLNTNAEVVFGLPTWHSVVHDRACRAENALVYQPGVGRTDGEGIERVWSTLNPAAYSTKEMAEGARADALEDRIDHLSFQKNLDKGELFRKRYIVAMEEYGKQQRNFEEIDGLLERDVSAQWKDDVERWNADRDNNPNPYTLDEQQSIGSREAEIRLDLAAEEAKAALAATAPLRDTSPSAFIVAALQLEETQRKLRFDIKHSTGVGLVAEGKIQQRRTAILQKLKTLREMQHIYAPGAIRAEEASSTDTTATLAENLPLHLPSDFSQEDRVTACEDTIVDIERRLRQGQCDDAIHDVRRHLRSKHHLIMFRDANVVGQSHVTRSVSLIDSVTHQVEFSVEKYRRARICLATLRGDLSQYPPLEDDDIRLDASFNEDAIAVQQLSNASERRKRKFISSGKRTLSWIWTAGGGPDDSEEGLLKTVKVEWSKALARRDCWHEEVCLLREEMKRTLRFLRSSVSRWDGIATSALRLGDPLSLGQAAYASRQSYIYDTIATRFLSIWQPDPDSNTPIEIPPLGCIDALPGADPGV